MKTSLIVMLLLGCGFDALEAAHAQQEDVSRIEAYCTPGKPSAVFDPTRPAEAIIDRHDGARYEPTVALNVPRKGIRAYSERSAALSRQDWDRLVALVQQQGLLSFKPDEEPGGFSITVRPESRSKAGPRTHSIEPRKSFPSTCPYIPAHPD